MPRSPETPKSKPETTPERKEAKEVKIEIPSPEEWLVERIDKEGKIFSALYVRMPKEARERVKKLIKERIKSRDHQEKILRSLEEGDKDAEFIFEDLKERVRRSSPIEIEGLKEHIENGARYAQHKRHLFEEIKREELLLDIKGGRPRHLVTAFDPETQKREEKRDNYIEFLKWKLNMLEDEDEEEKERINMREINDTRTKLDYYSGVKNEEDLIDEIVMQETDIGMKERVLKEVEKEKETEKEKKE